jgi:mono/diheme cytochrome c family protein
MKPLLMLFAAILLAACSPGTADSAESLPPGDAVRGAELFSETVNGAPACSTCHTLNGDSLVGPSFQDYAENAATRVSDLSAEEYTYTSIVRPPAHIVSGFSNSMYGQYARRLTSRQIADLVAYLLSL